MRKVLKKAVGPDDTPGGARVDFLNGLFNKTLESEMRTSEERTEQMYRAVATAEK